MKLFLVVVLALAGICQAEPEADPGHFYSNYHGYYGHPYSFAHHRGYGYGGYPYGYHGYAGAYPYRFGAYGAYHHRLHKRDADAQFVLPAAAGLPVAAGPAGVLPYAALNNVFNPYVYGPSAPVVTSVEAVVTPTTVTAEPLAVAPVAPVAPFLAPYSVAPAPTFVPAPVSTVAKSVSTPAGVAPVTPFRTLHPHACVTPEGCAVASLKIHGLAKREAEADPEAFYSAYAPYSYNPYYYGSYPYAYGAYPYGVYPYATAGYPYAPAAGYYGLPAAVAAAPAPVVSETVVAPAPVVQPAVYHAAPAVVPAARVAPVVEEVAKPVTYTHLGAHPVQPTTVLEKTSRVVGHTLF